MLAEAHELLGEVDILRRGRVVLFSSGRYHGAMPDELPYTASKAVVQQLTASLTVALAPAGITVNCVNPGGAS